MSLHETMVVSATAMSTPPTYNFRVADQTVQCGESSFSSAFISCRSTRALMCGFAKANCSNRRHPHAVNVCSFLSEVLNVQPTTSTVLAFGSDHRAAAAGPDPWWRSDDSLRPGRTVPCIDCGNPDPDCAAHFELRRSYLPDPHWADRDFWPMNPHLGMGT